jgi:VanZ family protein
MTLLLSPAGLPGTPVRRPGSAASPTYRVPMTPRLRLRLPSIVAALLALAVLAMLLVPRHLDAPLMSALSSSAVFGPAAAGGTPLWWALEDLANIALFVPLGYAFARWTGRPGLAVLLGVTLSAACEFAQVWIPQRHASLLDVEMNSTGAVLGVGAFLLLHRAARARRPRTTEA